MVAMVDRPLCVRSSGRLSQHGSPAASPAASPRSVVGTYDLDNLPVEWDNLPTVRERMRAGECLCMSFDRTTGKSTSAYVDATVENLRINCEILKPLVVIMEKHELQLPAIDKLIKAIHDLFDLAKLSRSEDQCYQEAWALRRLISKLKRFTYRPAPPQDLSSQNVDALSLYMDIPMFDIQWMKMYICGRSFFSISILICLYTCEITC